MMYNYCPLDLHYISVMASKLSTNITADLAIERLTEAIQTYKSTAGLMLHSDQVSQYTSKAFTTFCKSNKIQKSMSKADVPMTMLLWNLSMENLKVNILIITILLDQVSMI